MSDSGSWKLRCSHCGHVFELELAGSASIVEASQTSRCPACHEAPPHTAADNKEVFHRVVGFHFVKKPLPQHGL